MYSTSTRLILQPSKKRVLQQIHRSNGVRPQCDALLQAPCAYNFRLPTNHPQPALTRVQSTSPLSVEPSPSSAVSDLPPPDPLEPTHTHNHPITTGDLTRLIARASSAIEGSSALISQLLALHPSPPTILYHAALRALAVHPQPFTLHALLRRMRSAWHPLTSTGHHDIAASLIRNNQLEQAQEHIGHMRFDANPPVPPRPWLWDMMTYALLARGDVDEALRILHERVRIGAERQVGSSAWYAVFDEACTQLHYPAISFIWNRRVRSQLHGLVPSAGQCDAVLRAAARAGDTALAQSTLRTLSDIGVVLSVTHYELLMQACLEAGQLGRAVRILGTMFRAECTPYRASTRGLFQVLVEVEGAIDEMWEELERMRWGTPRDEKPERTVLPNATVPASAVDVVIEACIVRCGWAAVVIREEPGRSPRDENESENTVRADDQKTSHLDETTTNPSSSQSAWTWLNKALYYYKQMHKLAPIGPSRETFNLLLAGCAQVPNSKATAMFLANEMNMKGIAPSAMTYNHLIFVCLKPQTPTETAGKSRGEYVYEDGFRYLAEMQRRKMVPRPMLLKRLINVCVRAGDQRAWVLLEMMRGAGFDVTGVEDWVEKNLPKKA